MKYYGMTDGDRCVYLGEHDDFPMDEEFETPGVVVHWIFDEPGLREFMDSADKALAMEKAPGTWDFGRRMERYFPLPHCKNGRVSLRVIVDNEASDGLMASIELVRDDEAFATISIDGFYVSEDNSEARNDNEWYKDDRFGLYIQNSGDVVVAMYSDGARKDVVAVFANVDWSTEFATGSRKVKLQRG